MTAMRNQMRSGRSGAMVMTMVSCGALAAGCVPQPPPEPMLPRMVQTNATPEAFTAELLNVRTARGYFIKNQTANMLVIEKPADGPEDAAARFWLGSRWDGIPNYRLTYQFAGTGPMTVHVDAKVVTNPGTGFERPLDLNGHPSVNLIVREMQDIAAKLDGKAGQGGAGQVDRD